MATISETSDAALLNLIRRSGGATVAELADAAEVTPTAVRQRLTRLMAQGLVQRHQQRAGRGRPTHRYVLTEKARRLAGSNFADLAVVMWRELRNVPDLQVRRGLFKRLAERMAEMYAPEVRGQSLSERIESVVELFAEREVQFEAGQSAGLPVLNAVTCPYPELAEQDRTICSMERILFSELLGEQVSLSRCRLDGETCCTFQSSAQHQTT